VVLGGYPVADAMSKKKRKRRRHQPPDALRSGGEASGSSPAADDEGFDDASPNAEGEWIEGSEEEGVPGNDATASRRAGPLRTEGSAARRSRGEVRRRPTSRRPARPTRPAARGRPQDPQPPILAPLARSLIVVGTSPLILGTAFLSVLAIWLIYTSTGIIAIASPAAMGLILSLPPVHSLLDVLFLFAALRVFSWPLAIGLGAVLFLARAAFLSLLLALIVGSLDRRVRHATWGDELRAAGRRAYSVFQFVFALEVGMVVAVYALSSILGTFLGPLGVRLAVAFEMYLLVLAPVVATTERLGAAASVRLSTRAARLRGPQHTATAFLYAFIALYVMLDLRVSRATPATPSIAVWAYVLFATFVQISLLMALTYRWLLVRDVVGADEERDRSTRSQRARAR
jgi:hypothetical protein